MKKFYLFIMLFLTLGITNASEKILVERYDNWEHPALSIFKKYGITLYKVSYSPDGKCLIFYGRFQYFFDTQDLIASPFRKVYFDVLKANSFFPYVLVNEYNNFLINVGWLDEKRTLMAIDMQKGNAVSICQGGAFGVEKAIISSLMKERILRSPLKKSLRRNDGTVIEAYLYAEDEQSIAEKSSARFTGILTRDANTIPHYYIYLYDIKIGTFLPYRTAIYTDSDKTKFNFDSESLAELAVLSGSTQKKSDVLLVGQFAGSYGNVYEAYGFSENGLYLRNYLFVGQEKHKQFKGLVANGSQSDKLSASMFHNDSPSYTLELSLYLSKNDGEVIVQLLNNLPEGAEPFDY